MIANIYIKGQIGSTYDDNGNVKIKGVEVIDVVEQLAKYPDAERTNIYINSEGGYVNVGRDIAELIKTIPNAYTIASELCASIATEIHLAVPLENRLIEEGTTYMIHNPLFMGVSGDSETLKRMSEDIAKTENEMEAMYSKATGLSKEMLSSLMKVETYLTDEQAVNFKFAYKVVPKRERKAVALINNQIKTEMEKSFKERLTKAMAVLAGKEEEPQANGRNAVAMDITTDKGVLSNEFDDLIIGDAVTLNGEPAPTDTYTSEDGKVLVVVDGVVTDIQETEPVMDDEMATIKAENEALKAQVEELTSKVAKIEELEAEKAQLNEVAESALAKLEELAQKGSTFTPPASAQTFKPTPNKKKSLAERRAELIKK